MKTCPNCEMTTDSHSHCAVCGYEVSEISHVERKSEKYVLNKYFWRFLFTKHIFPLICVVIAIVCTVIILPDVNRATLGAISLSVLCLLTSLYREAFIHHNSWRFSEDYLEATHNVMNIAAGVMSISFAVLSVCINYMEFFNRILDK